MILPSKRQIPFFLLLLFLITSCGGGITKRTRPVEEPDFEKEGFKTAFEFHGTSAKDQMEKARYLIGNADFEKALEVLRNIIKSFPDDELADDSQFLIGDIYSSPLNNNRDKDKAIRAYRQIVDLYPESELVKRAEQRIWEVKSQP